MNAYRHLLQSHYEYRMHTPWFRLAFCFASSGLIDAVSKLVSQSYWNAMPKQYIHDDYARLYRRSSTQNNLRLHFNVLLSRSVSLSLLCWFHVFVFRILDSFVRRSLTVCRIHFVKLIPNQALLTLEINRKRVNMTCSLSIWIHVYNRFSLVRLCVRYKWRRNFLSRTRRNNWHKIDLLCNSIYTIWSFVFWKYRVSFASPNLPSDWFVMAENSICLDEYLCLDRNFNLAVIYRRSFDFAHCALSKWWMETRTTSTLSQSRNEYVRLAHTHATLRTTCSAIHLHNDNNWLNK